MTANSDSDSDSDSEYDFPDLPKLDRFPSQEEVDATLPPEGFIVYTNFLSSKQVEKIRKSFNEQILWQIYTRAGVDVDFSNASDKVKEKYSRAMFDIKLRRKLIPDEEIMKDTVGNVNNFRKPHINQQDGMVSIHHNTEVIKYISTNRKIFKLLRKHYRGYKFLAFSNGPEKGSEKDPGSIRMKLHADAGHNYNYPKLSPYNYKTRIQCLITISRDPDAPKEKSGTLEVIANYCTYFNLFSLATRDDGPIPIGVPERRFFVFPNNFETEFLPMLNQLAKEYTQYQNTGKIKTSKWEKFFKSCKSKGIIVPKKFTECYLHCVDAREGDLVLWSQYTPHRSRENETETTRMVIYYSLLPVKKNWWKSEEAEWVKDQYTSLKSYYSVNHGKYPRDPRNPEELKFIKKYKLREEIKELYRKKRWFRIASAVENPKKK